MRRRLTALLIAAAMLAGLVGAQAEGMSSEEALRAFAAFSENAAGRYIAQEGEDLIVLELLPAFGRLFASKAYYAEGGCLYSYSAAELSPGDLTRPENREGNSETSFSLAVRNWSNMSMAGEYWPGVARQRLTLTEDGLLLSDRAGDGEPLAADGLMLREDAAPSVLVYGPDSETLLCNAMGMADLPEDMAGDWNATWRAEGVDAAVRISFDAEGFMTALFDRLDGRPPRFMKGGFSLYGAADGAFDLRALLASPDSGEMPIEISARLTPEGDGLRVSALEGEDCLLLPDEDAVVTYARGAEPLRRAFMTLANPRDGQKFFDVTVRDPMDGSEELITVMKDGSTLFGWSSAWSQLKLSSSVWARITAGMPLPVLYSMRWSTADLILLLGDIAEDSRLLTLRAPYYAALGDYREYADEGWRGGEARVFFDEAGEPTLCLENRTDYAVQRDLTARVTRRVGNTYTAVDENGNRVTFEIQSFGWLEIVEQNLTFATHGFPGFGQTYYRVTE